MHALNRTNHLTGSSYIKTIIGQLYILPVLFYLMYINILLTSKPCQIAEVQIIIPFYELVMYVYVDMSSATDRT